MGKAVVQTAAALKSCLPRVLDLLLAGQGVPFLVTLLVAEDIVGFGKQEGCNGKEVDDDEVLVSAVVVGSIVRTVYVGRDDTAHLDKDVV